MINALLGKIEGLFDKEFLFASFLPTLVFLASIATTLAGVVGSDSTWAWLEAWTVTQRAVLVAVAGVGAVMVAYLVHGVRGALLLLWSGRVGGPLAPVFYVGEEMHRRRYVRLRQRAFRPPRWEGLFEWFRQQVTPHWDTARPAPGDAAIRTLMADVGRLHEGMTPTDVRARLSTSIVDAYRQFSGNALAPVYAAVRQRLEEWEEQEQDTLAKERARLDRLFGDLQSIRGTALGNVVESYSSYPYKRYKIDGEAFWPHLQTVVKKEFMDTIREFRIVLDFCLAMATFALLYALLATFVGPWLWWRPWFWFTLAGVAAFVACAIYYRFAVFVATQYGDQVRASFDLFRLELLDGLYREHPATREVELEAWEQVSQLLVFGQVRDFALRGRR